MTIGALGVAGVGAIPPGWSFVIASVGIIILAGAVFAVRRAHSISPEQILVIDADGMALVGVTSWRLPWSDIRHVRLEHIGPQGTTTVTVNGAGKQLQKGLPRGDLVSIDLGFGTATPRTIRDAVRQFAPGRC